MWGSREWPDIGPNDLLVVCSTCVDAGGHHEGVFMVDEGPDGAIVGRLVRGCSHSDSPPPFPSVVERYLASWRRLCDRERDDPRHVMVQEIRVGDASWTLGRRVDVLRKGPRM
jgi:hypothetical protein